MARWRLLHGCEPSLWAKGHRPCRATRIIRFLQGEEAGAEANSPRGVARVPAAVLT